VRFHSSKAVEKLVGDLARAARSRAQFVHDPHASLLYKKPPVAAKKELASTIRLPFREVVFDAIKTIRCASATRTGNDVEAWRVAIAKSLRE
jgi:hypothetical protein